MEVELDYWTARRRVEIEKAGCASLPSQVEAASLVGLVIAQIPADFYVADDIRNTTIGDAIAEAPRCGAL